MSRDRTLITKLYKSFERPYLECAILAQSPHLNQDIETLEKKLQSRATKIISGMEKLSDAERLKRLNLTTLKSRRIRGDLILVVEKIKGMDDPRLDFSFICVAKTKTGSAAISTC